MHVRTRRWLRSWARTTRGYSRNKLPEHLFPSKPAFLPQAINVAEDVSGMPTLCRPVAEGGVGFDYRLGMGTPDLWVKLVKEQRDEDWSMSALVSSLCNRRRSERTVGYVESHDQSLVGDQTLGDPLASPLTSIVCTFSAVHQSQAGLGALIPSQCSA